MVFCQEFLTTRRGNVRRKGEKNVMKSEEKGVLKEQETCYHIEKKQSEFNITEIRENKIKLENKKEKVERAPIVPYQPIVLVHVSIEQYKETVDQVVVV